MEDTHMELHARAVLDFAKLRDQIAEVIDRVDELEKLLEGRETPKTDARLHIGSRVYLKALIPKADVPIGTWGAILVISPEEMIGVLFAWRSYLLWFRKDKLEENLEFAYETYEDLRQYKYMNAEILRKDFEAGRFKCLERRGIVNDVIRTPQG